MADNSINCEHADTAFITDDAEGDTVCIICDDVQVETIDEEEDTS